MGYHLDLVGHTGQVVTKLNVPFVFSQYRQYWSTKAVHGHTALRECAVLKAAIEVLLYDEGIQPAEEQPLTSSIDVIATKEVFLAALYTYHKVCEKYPNTVLRLENGAVNLTILANAAPEYCPEDIYYCHPKKGVILVDTFAVAAEVYTIETLQKRPSASDWFGLCQRWSPVAVRKGR